MKAGVVTLFPELFETFASTSVLGRAVSSGRLGLSFEHLRPHGVGRHLCVDDTPYGGGAGMVLRVDCIVEALEALEVQMGQKPHRVLLTPQGQRFEQATARRWSELPAIAFICGRYEGFDERVRSYVDEEASLGDFVLTGGEIAAMAMLEATVRLLPAVLGNEESAAEESFSAEQSGGLEYPHYTRPAEFRGAGVPDVLKSGHHEQIRQWRASQAQVRTAERRPELLPTGTAGVGS